ncbi:transcription factor bHLH110 isoform X3 [Hevea brasiliensis]|uniref:transcription factor bHLH110 isoform X3 n=1 Tax=Hevea brasiliensis TaxID=3981 RepID=UPI0025DBB8F9|nr:transcription factor bHLH110 isoform X3 [Hevea brasiliensis]
MESANLHHQHHQLQGQPHVVSSTAQSNYGAGSPHAWTQNITLSTGNFNPSCNGVDINPRRRNETLVPPVNSSMIQELGFHWNSNAAGSFTNQSAHDLQLAKIKQELSTESFPKFTEMVNIPSSIEEDSHLSSTSYIEDKQKDMSTDLSEKLLLKTISSGFPINGHHQFSPRQIYPTTAHDCSSLGSSIPGRGNFSQIYPSINISNFNRSPPSISGSFDMNLQALDLLTSTRFNGSFGQPSHDNLGIYKDNISYSLDHMHMPCSPSKTSSFTTNQIPEPKRPNNSLMEPKATQLAAPKKSRLESRASCPPFKVRKEKLGDRISALQQLVAPFGKTDTASVLMEAIGYIKFLQNQTLSVPYMKSSRNKTSIGATQTFQGSTMEDGNDDEPKKDLRSRGLCLVPLSCMSYVTGDGGGGGIWPPPNFGGGT